jgi:glycine dehydrogenase subunit 1
MLPEIHANSVEDFFADIPTNLRFKGQLRLPEGKSDQEVERHVVEVLSANRSVDEVVSFLGGGVWNHYVPAAVDAIISRGEFLTSYTPYQAEISQGILQALFEYQSMICELTRMDFANSSLYDWSTALAEAARMAARVTGRNQILYARYIGPERRAVLETSSKCVGIQLHELSCSKQTGQVDQEDLRTALTEKVAAVYLEYPSYLGSIDLSIKSLADPVHRAGALLIVGVDPIALGVLKPPGEFGADIVVGEGQPLGSSMNGGGPLLGIFACTGGKLLRHMPGRLIGMTTTKDGKDAAYAMALQTREQHIRRERATSNVCTNEALLAVAAAVYMSMTGASGLRELGFDILERSHEAANLLSRLPGVRAPAIEAPYFKEFVVNFDQTGRTVRHVNENLFQNGILGGWPLVDEFPELGESALYCVTEMTRSEAVTQLVGKLREALA